MNRSTLTGRRRWRGSQGIRRLSVSSPCAVEGGMHEEGQQDHGGEQV